MRGCATACRPGASARATSARRWRSARRGAARRASASCRCCSASSRATARRCPSAACSRRSPRAPGCGCTRGCTGTCCAGRRARRCTGPVGRSDWARPRRRGSRRWRRGPGYRRVARRWRGGCGRGGWWSVSGGNQRSRASTPPFAQHLQDRPSKRGPRPEDDSQWHADGRAECRCSCPLPAKQPHRRQGGCHPEAPRPATPVPEPQLSFGSDQAQDGQRHARPGGLGDRASGLGQTASVRGSQLGQPLQPGARALAFRRVETPDDTQGKGFRTGLIHRYRLRNRSTAETSAVRMPGSSAECPASGTIVSRARGQAWASSNAVSAGQTMS